MSILVMLYTFYERTIVNFDLMRTAEDLIRCPVPWALTEETSFVARVSDYRDMLTAAGFQVTSECHRRAVAKLGTDSRAAGIYTSFHIGVPQGRDIRQISRGHSLELFLNL
jgi:hypothetical protein